MKLRNLFLTVLAILLSACGAVSVSTPTPTPYVEQPDLVITNLYLSMQGLPPGWSNCVPAYGPYEIRMVIENHGLAPATNVFAVEQSTGYQIQIGTLEVFQIIEMPIPLNSASGSYTVVADPQNLVAESDESNNVYSYITPTPTPPAICSPTPPSTISTLPPPTSFQPSVDGLIYADLDLAQIWKFAPGGQPVKYMDGIHGQFSPDGSEALYELSGDLWLIEPTNGSAVNLTNTPNAPETAPQWWASNSGKIIFNSNPEHNGPHIGYLSMLNKDGSELLILTDTPAYNQPSASGDGKTIAYDALGTPMLYEIGSGPRAFDPTQYGYSPAAGILFTSPSFSPDGRWLSWWTSEELFEPQRHFALVLFDLSAKTSRIVHEYTPLSGTLGWVPAPIWSPSGNWIAFQTRGEVTPQDLWIVHRDGGIGTRLGLATNPVWRPNSQQLVYVQWPPASDSYLSAVTSIVDVPSWNVQQVNVPAGSIPLAWPTETSP